MSQDASAGLRILNYAGLKGRGVPYTRQHLGRLEAAGRFPERVQLGEGRVGWIESEVDDWIRALPRGPIPIRSARRKSAGAREFAERAP